MSKFRVAVEADFNLGPSRRQGPFVFNVMAESRSAANSVALMYVLGRYRCSMQRDGSLHFLVADLEHQHPDSVLFPWGAGWPDRTTVLFSEEFQ